MIAGLGILLGSLAVGLPDAPPEPATILRNTTGVRAGDASVEQALSQVVTKLDSPSIYDRLEAQDELRRVAGTRLATVEALLSRPNLSAEQIERLSTVGYSIFSAQPRAAMGVRFALVEGNGEGVAIDGLIGGFDAAAVLLPGDVIRSIAGVPIQLQMDARRVIISYEPGEEVPVEIVRQGQLRDVRVKLGAYNDLNNGLRAAVDSASLRLAWETRVARTRHAVMAVALGTGLSKDRTDALRAQASMPRMMRVRGIAEGHEVVSTVGDGPLLVAAGRSRAVEGTFNRLFRSRGIKGDLWTDLEARTDQANKVLEQSRALQAVLRDAKLPADQRLRQEFNHDQVQRLLISGAMERREAWKTLRVEQEATEEPH